MMRRRPIPRSDYHYQPSPKGASLRYELILNGAVRKYPDGRDNRTTRSVALSSIAV